MYASNLSWGPIKERLAELEKGGLITFDNSREFVEVYLTKKGERAIDAFERVVDAIGLGSSARL